MAVTPPGPTCPSGLVASGQSACATAGGVAGAGGVATGGVVGGATDVVVGSSHPLRSRRTHRREHTHGNAIVSSSSSSSSSSDDEAGREHEGAGVHLRSSRHRHMGGVSQTAAGGAGVEGAVGVSSSSSGGRVESVLREDQSEVVCGRQEFKEVSKCCQLSWQAWEGINAFVVCGFLSCATRRGGSGGMCGRRGVPRKANESVTLRPISVGWRVFMSMSLGVGVEFAGQGAARRTGTLWGVCQCQRQSLMPGLAHNTERSCALHTLGPKAAASLSWQGQRPFMPEIA